MFVDQGTLDFPEPESRDSLNALVFPRKVKDFIRELEKWRESRDWYASLNMAWRRGALLYGRPGTGKTATVRALGRDLNLPVISLYLAQMTDGELRSYWHMAATSSPCIILVEDIDNVFHGRENITPMAEGYRNGTARTTFTEDDKPRSIYDGLKGGAVGQPVQFDTLLQLMDGVENLNGVLTIFTTNDVSKVDEALGRPQEGAAEGEWLSTRPGRLDLAIELTFMTPEDRTELIEKLLKREPEIEAEVHAFYAEQPDREDTPAQVQERCVQAALAAFWKRQDAA